ncbi:hypothetical protein J5474_18655 [Sagittula sp. M10.9X]|uniref:Capsular polysaccharide transport system permease protein n=1 Tax=Sagittula salina TaxID=2820268 RepID=A0A940MN09_9RHOB|nr:hypothetical protein [Sagittula salina]MBP0484496.1 hypothetical protein [Sagittula salina]
MSQVKKIPTPPDQPKGQAPSPSPVATAETALQSLEPRAQPGTRITPVQPHPQPHHPPPHQPRPAARPMRAQPTAGAARLRRRHWALLCSFAFGVLLPAALVGLYLLTRAADQYASTVAFSVRTEKANPAVELLGGITALSGSSSSSDTDILHEYLQSQKIVADIDAQIDLRAMWSGPYDRDPWFAFDQSGTIEDLVEQWARMVRLSYDDGAGLIEVRVLAFTPQDAQTIAQALFDHSSRMINELSDIAREDAIRYARADLDEAQARLSTARAAVTRFRNENQMVDPAADLESQAGLLGSLQQQLANLLVEYDLLAIRTRKDDPRLRQAEARITVVRNRIEEERRKLGLAGTGEAETVPDDGSPDGGPGRSKGPYATLYGEYERLVVDREFAEASYTAARAGFDAARAEARRQSRYLAAYVRPTLAQSARFPERGVLMGLASLLILLVWGTLILVLYALRDRR